MRFNPQLNIRVASAIAFIAITLVGASLPSKVEANTITYRIRNAGGKCLDVKGGAISTIGTQVQIYTCNNTPAQQWVQDSYTPPGPGGTLYTIFRNPVSNMCLDVKGGAINTNGTPLQIYPCNKTAAQTWWQNVYQKSIVNQLTYNSVNYGDKCLDVRNGNIYTDWTPVQIYTCNGTSAQKWDIVNFGLPLTLVR